MADRTVIIRMIADTKGFTGGVLGAAKASQGLGKGLGKLVPSLGGLSTGALAAGAAIGLGAVAVGKSIGMWNRLDDSMGQSLAIMGDVSDMQRKEMTDAAREVAKVTTFSAEQAADSYFYLASAGLDAKASMEALPVVADFAQAGMFDMATATDLLTDAQSALGLTIRDDAIGNMNNMTKVGDVLVKANTLANASVQQFSEALTNKAGPAMRAAGIGIEEGVAVLSAFADQGIKGSEAGTQFGIVLRDLQTKAIKNKDAFAEMGIEVFDAQGNLNNMGDIIGDVEGALAGMSTEQQKSTLLMLGFSDKSVAALQALIGTSDQIKVYEDGLKSAGGTTEDVADKQLKSFSQQMKLAGSALKDAGLSIGESFAPVLADLVPVLRWVANAVADLAKIIGPVLGFAIKTILQPFKTLIWAGKGIVGWFSKGQRESNRFAGELHDLEKAVKKGANKADAYKEALIGVADKSSLTADRLEELQGAVGELSQKELADGAKAALDYGKANGATAESISTLTQQVTSNADALYQSGQMTLDEIEATYGSATAYEVADMARRRARQSTYEGIDALAASKAALDEEGAAADEAAMSAEDLAKKLTDMSAQAADAARQFSQDLFNSMSNFTTLFDKVPKKVKVSLDKMEGNFTGRFKMQDRFWRGLRKLADAGMTGLVAELRKAGPEAVDQVEKLAGDLGKAAEFEDMIDSAHASMLEMSDGITNALGIEEQAWTAMFFEAGEAMALALQTALSGADRMEALKNIGIDYAEAIKLGLVANPINLNAVGPGHGFGAIARAGGGPVQANMTYLVGERGPELFVPTSAGQILPAGGGSVSLTINNPTTHDLPRDLQAGVLRLQTARLVGG